MAGFFNAPSISPQMGGGSTANPQLLALLSALGGAGGGQQQSNAPTLPTPQPQAAGAFIPPAVMANPGPGQAASQTGSALSGLGSAAGGNNLDNLKQVFAGGKGPNAQLGAGETLAGGTLNGPGYVSGQGMPGATWNVN